MTRHYQRIRTAGFVASIAIAASMAISCAPAVAEGNGLENGAKPAPGNVAQSAAVDAYPDKPISFINTSAAGSSLDVMMRTLGKFLSDELHQNIIVQDKPGGTGAVGMAYAIKQPADGYTIVSATGSTSFQMADPHSNFTPDQFIFFRGLQAEPSAVVVNKNSRFKTLAQLVDALRKSPDKVNVGGYAAAGFHQFVFYRLQQAGHFRAVWVPFNGGNEASMALMGHQLDAAIMTPSTALGQIKSGQFRLLAISTARRDPSFPDVPTFKEQGYNVVESLWRGVMVKQGTARAIVAKLSAAMNRVEANPKWKEFMAANYQLPVDLTPEQMQRKVVDEVQERRVFLKSIDVGAQ
jgi:putative tricarboxylic transport membrane protein